MRTPIPFPAATVALAIALSPSVASGQSEPTLSPGDEVIVTWFDRYAWTSGAFPGLRHETLDVVSVDPGQLMATRGDRVYIIGTENLRSVRRRLGTKPASAPAMVAGSAGGFVAALLIGAVGAASQRGGDAWSSGLSSGVLVGAPLGAFVAWIASRSRGIYDEIHLPGMRL